MTTRKRALTIAGVVVAALAVAGFSAWVQTRSQALLDARHPLAPSAVRADGSPAGIAAGGHLVQTTACGICHGQALTGKLLGAAGSAVYAPNLTIRARKASDAELDRAIRAGLRADGTAELSMPAQVYRGFTDAEVGQILGYLRSLPERGRLLPRPKPGPVLRADIALGIYHLAPERVASSPAALDAGPATALGRHLAGLACGQCHGPDLGGRHGAPGPDLDVRGAYDRVQFHRLMRTGNASSGHDLDLMSDTARSSFSHFTDAEIDSIYDYLDARDGVLVARAKARR